MKNSNVNWSEAARLTATILVIAFLWNTWLVYPLRSLVVVFHELSHAIAAWATGGSVVRIELVANEGGMCFTQGGIRILIMSAGYIGSLLWGGAFLLLSKRTRSAATTTVLLAALLLAIAGIWVRPILSFGFLFIVVTGSALVAIGVYAPPPANAFVLKLIGLTSCMYAPFDIASDILAHPTMPSDAHSLAILTGVPTLIWGSFWFLTSLVISGWFLVSACRGGSAQIRKA